MKLAVLSGKGGTGKTLLSVNIAASMSGAIYLDCDVEAPNGRLFFKPEGLVSEGVTVRLPVVDHELCTGCRICTDFCRFNAMAFIGGKVKVFEDICHSCGGCEILCPVGAITEFDKEVGVIEQGYSGQNIVATGIMHIGQASGVPIIEKLIEKSGDHEGTIVIDCPPGSACVVMESIKEADYCLIVAEPTVFGLHNMTMVHELVRKMKKPCGLVINKSYGSDQMITDYCSESGLPIIGTIAYDETLASIGSQGGIAVRDYPGFQDLFRSIVDKIKEEVTNETAIGFKR